MLVRNARTLLLAVLAAALAPAAALALGLGDIHLHSALNAPLDAQIELVGANTDDMAGLKATLASREDYGRDNLNYPGFLGTVTLQPQHLIDGRNIIEARSTGVATEPFATLLVQVDWAHGHLVREYTVLIDPPTLTGSTAGNTAIAAPTAGGTARSGAVQRTAPAAAATPASSASGTATRGSGSAAAAGGNHVAGGNYAVRRGDTLFSVASSQYGAADLSRRRQQMVAIYRANPQAFNDNMNELLAGQQLALPSDADVAAIGPAAAADEVRQQIASWKGATRTAAPAAGARLRLVPPQAAQGEGQGDGQNEGSTGAQAAGVEAAGAGGADAAQAAALRQQVQSLQSQLTESKRLLQARNAQLAALQAAAAARAGKGGTSAAGNSATAAPAAAAPAAAGTPAAAAPAAAVSPEAAPAAAPGTPASTSASTPASAPAPAAAARTVAPAAPASSATGSGGLAALASEYWYIPAALIAALIILLALRRVRARQEQEFDRSLDRLGSMTLDAPVPAPRSTETVPLRPLGATRKEQSFLVEESGSREQPDFGGIAATGQHVAIDDTVSGEAPVALDQGDPLAEADFHMAYGLYDQAADLVQIALTREPARRDLKLKLLEVFFVWGNRDRFLQTARELAATREQSLPGEWEKTVIMGRQIAPEDPLFAGSGSVQAAAHAGVDLNLEGGQNRVDFDLLGEPSVSPQGDAGGLDLDLGAALGQGADENGDDATGEAQRLGDSGVDFVLDDPERGNELTGSTREMPTEGSGNTATVQTEFGRDAELPTVEQPQLHEADNPTIREKLDAPTRIGLMNSGDQTAELALDDLGLDLGSLGEADEGVGGADQATLLAGLDDEARRLMARTEAHGDAAPATLAPAHADPAHTDPPCTDVDATGNAPLYFDLGADAAPGSQGEETGAAASPPPAAEPGAGPTASGTWLFSDQDFSEIVGDRPGSGADAPTELVTVLTPGLHDASPTSRLAALSGDDLDLDLGAFGAGPAAPGGATLDLDVGTDTAGAGDATGQVQQLGGDEQTLPDLEPVTLSEVGTKLDLARAYMDMGDPEGARSILQEVMTEGSGSQKQEARRLIDALPG